MKNLLYRKVGDEMTNQYPWRPGTTPSIAAQDDPRYETPGGAQEKVDSHISQTNNLADRIVTQPKIAYGAVGGNQLDPALLQNYGDIAVQGQFQVVNEQLADNAISPEKFSGNALQKIQQALDYAILNNVAVKLSKMYNITGLGVLMINKPQNHSPNTNRKPLYVTGVGGGIIKNDSGYAFSAPLVDIGELYLDGVKFHSIEGAGTKIYDGNKLINIFSSFNFYLNCDTIADANSRYSQGWNFFKDVIVGGHGWAFEADHYWALKIKDCVIEWRQNGIRNSGDILKANYSVDISGNTLENLTGEAIQINSTQALAIKGNYLEFNDGGYITINSQCLGAEISNNYIEPTEGQISANTPSINLPVGVYKSIGNKSKGTLYKMSVNTVLYSDCDEADAIATGDLKFLYRTEYDGDAVTYNATTGVVKKYGSNTLYANRVTVSFNALETKSVNILFPAGVYNDDHISVRVQGVGFDGGANLLNYYLLDSSTVRATIQSVYNGVMTIDIYVTVLKVGNLSHYG